MPIYPSDQSTAGAECARFAEMLPLLGAGELTADEATTVRRHSDSCPWCSQQLAAYATLDAALHRHLNLLLAAAPMQSKETLMQNYQQDGQLMATQTAIESPVHINHPSRGIFSGIAALAAVLLIALLAGLIFASRSGGHAHPEIGSTNVPVQTTCDPNKIPPGVPGSHITINSISMVSATDGWAVGTITNYQITSRGQNSGSVIMRLSNGKWTQFGPTYPVDDLESISMDTPNDGWALGTWNWANGTPRELLLHYTDGRWVQVSAFSQDHPDIAGTIKVLMVSPGEGWMLIQDNSSRNPRDPASRGMIIIRHYQNGTWTLVPIPSMPDTVEFHDMSATPDGGVWFVGPDYGNGPNIIAHYYQRQWSLTREQPGTPDLMLESISMISATDGWALGTLNGEQGQPTFLLHYNGTSWTRTNLPGDLALDYWERLNVSANGEVWLTGYQQDALTAVLTHYVNGNWQHVSLPYSNMFVFDIVEVAPGEFWGTGMTSYQWGCAPALVSSVLFGSFLHYANGSWNKQDLP